MADIYQILSDRGFVSDCTDADGFKAFAAKPPMRVYCGFDPTATSLTIGNLVCIMALKQFQLAGHQPMILMGGATGMIGDPSGKSAERNLQTIEQVQANLASQREQFKLVLDFDGPNPAIMVNNYDWLGKISFIDFLRDVGKFFRVGEMLGKESVRSRMNSDSGISFTEMSYMMLQAEDFRHLLRAENCRVQVGGADQWGNIVAGIDLIRKTTGETAFGLTFPLITTASGQKLGKTEAGAVWLDPARTSPYEFYQYWVRCDDRDVERYLKLFTLLDLDEIAAICADHATAPEKRAGQKRLALEVTRLIHGEEEAGKSRDAAEALYGSALENLSDERLRELFPDVPSVSVPRVQLCGDGGIDLLDVLVTASLAPSKKEGKKLLQQGGLYLNNVQVPADKRTLGQTDLASDSMLILRAGKKRYCLVKAE